MRVPVDAGLIESAERLIAARADGVNHTVAAAARASDDRVVTGLNVYHFAGGPCAELVAIGNAAAEGAAGLRQIVAVGDSGRGILAPCGRCRQVLFDYFPSLTVVIGSGTTARAVGIMELLPWPSRWDEQSGSSVPE